MVERAQAPRAGGQAIDIRGPALAVMREMELLDQAISMRTHLKGMSTLDIDGNELSRMEERTLSGGRFNSGDVEILRDDLAGLLLSASQSSASYIYGDTIVALEEDKAGVTVTFEKELTRRFDLVIGADGLHSNIRQLVFGTPRSIFDLAFWLFRSCTRRVLPSYANHGDRCGLRSDIAAISIRSSRRGVRLTVPSRGTHHGGLTGRGGDLYPTGASKAFRPCVAGSCWQNRCSG